MATRYNGSDSAPSSLPPPHPKSPPEYPDLYGKRRETAKVQVLEREIGFLEVELKSENGLQPASRCCKEIVDFMAANSDPLIPTNKKNLRRYHRFGKWLCGLPCFNLSWICCCCCHSGCALQIEIPRRCCDSDCNCTPSCELRKCLKWRPNWQCCSFPRLHCCKNMSFDRICCCSSLPSLPSRSFSKCSCFCPKCSSLHPSCSCCCFNPCYLCY